MGLGRRMLRGEGRCLGEGGGCRRGERKGGVMAGRMDDFVAGVVAATPLIRSPFWNRSFSNLVRRYLDLSTRN